MSRSALIIGAMIASGALYAAPITGRLILNGNTLAGVDGNAVDFNYTYCGSGTPFCPADANAATTGTFVVGFGSNGSFIPATPGTIESFSRAEFPTGVPQSALFTDPQFIGLPNIKIVLRTVLEGSFADCGNPFTEIPAAGQFCTPNDVSLGGRSPLELSNSPGGAGGGDGTGLSSSAKFNVIVDAYNIATQEHSIGNGTFSTNVAGYSYQTLLQQVFSGNSVTSGFNGDFVIDFRPDDQVPEPGTWAMGLVGLGLIGLSRFAHKRKVN